MIIFNIVCYSLVETIFLKYLKGYRLLFQKRQKKGFKAGGTFSLELYKELKSSRLIVACKCRITQHDHLCL